MVTKQEAREHLAANLQKLIRDGKAKQADIARAIQLADEDLQTTRQRVYRYVHGLTDVTGDDLSNMGEFLGVSTDWLLSAPKRKKARRVG